MLLMATLLFHFSQIVIAWVPLFGLKTEQKLRGRSQKAIPANIEHGLQKRVFGFQKLRAHTFSESHRQTNLMGHHALLGGGLLIVGVLTGSDAAQLVPRFDLRIR
jgi:hypothetical protein